MAKEVTTRVWSVRRRRPSRATGAVGHAAETGTRTKRMMMRKEWRRMRRTWTTKMKRRRQMRRNPVRRNRSRREGDRVVRSETAF